MPSKCGATSVASHDGFFALRIANESIGLPATAQALRQPGELPFAAVVVPSGMQAHVPPAARDRGAIFLPASPTRSGSALVRGDLPLSVENVEWNRLSISILVFNPPSGGAHPVAAMVVDPSQWPSTRVLLTALSLPDSVPPAPGLDVARDEHLYTLAFRQSADALYCTPAGSAGCDGGQTFSQGETLQRLALQRECAFASLPSGLRADLPSWRVVTLKPAEVLPGPKARVSARVLDQDAPIAGARVMFSRLPHSACTATTQADGTATCELADTYGHDGGHPEFDRAPVLVTFPGDLRGNPILLPTTKLMVPDNGTGPNLRMR